LLKVKVKSNEEKEKEEQEHIEWLKGRRDKVNPEIEKNMVCAKIFSYLEKE
jgi:hypothetical protein